MPNAPQGSVVSLWRYPVKSMLGEEFTTIEATERGLLGDRAYARVDSVRWQGRHRQEPEEVADAFRLPRNLHRTAAFRGECASGPHHPAGWHHRHQ